SVGISRVHAVRAIIERVSADAGATHAEGIRREDVGLAGEGRAVRARAKSSLNIQAPAGRAAGAPVEACRIEESRARRRTRITQRDRSGIRSMTILVAAVRADRRRKGSAVTQVLVDRCRDAGVQA